MNTLTKSDAWQDLIRHQSDMRSVHIRNLFTKEQDRFSAFHITCDGLLFDYSKHKITRETISLLCGLARFSDLEGRRDRLFKGDAVNTTEKRAALHPALRSINEDDRAAKLWPDAVSEYVHAARDEMRRLGREIRNNQNITDIVHIGIGGSDLGPHMVYEALKHTRTGPAVHFVSNVDGLHITETLARLKPESTVFIIASKTFSTLETCTNMKTAQGWAANRSRFIAVTANTEEALRFGIKASDILPLKSWIGGRYSLWSAVGLSLALAFGDDAFDALLSGARAMDTHFLNTPLERNIPVIMALLGIWYRNFWDYRAHAILPYAQNLHRLPRYIQQLEMESNGKHVDRDGHTANYATAPVVFGEPGTNAQHAFLQLLHQGTEIIPCDFIAAVHPDHALSDHHEKLLANALAQSKALMIGDKAPDGAAHKNFPGNRPSSTLLLNRLDAHHLGMLLALYEHKVFVQGVIWRINSFDQWGVELGKTLARSLVENITRDETPDACDSSTRGLLDHIRSTSA